MISKVLIANRGEIALRVMRTCKEMGIKTVAVYSEADQLARHVRFADEAYCIGAGPSSESYLKMETIIDLCKSTGAQAVHPGYGFLSENAVFARRLKEEGLILIGPTAEAMEMMGSKIASKQAVEKYGVPLVPGINEAIKDVDAALQVAIKVGFPVLIKASAGGGGKGMRVVYEESEFLSSLVTAQNEARNAFGDDSVFIEKYVGNPRHIEFQILADNYGNVVHLFERECSIQRRHQKLVEEAPSAVLTNEMRHKMGDAAVNVAKACNYSGAGTVEFLLGDGEEFYFLEMNTRLQVEHPVTEMITGLDLVKLQIQVAQGEKLPFKQEDLTINGHSLELRVCAEDPYQQFLPNIGTVKTYVIPAGPGIRIDDCMEPHLEIPIYYDNMLSKLVVWAPTRQEAIERMKRAIEEYIITGIQTTLPFGTFVMNHPKFIEGDFNTHFIQNYFQPDAEASLVGEGLLDLTSAAAYFWENRKGFSLSGDALTSGSVADSGSTSASGSGSGSGVTNGSSDWVRNRKNLR